MDALKKPLFLIAALALAIAFCIEVGSSFFRPPEPTRAQMEEQVRREDKKHELSNDDVKDRVSDMLEARDGAPPRPGMGIPYMALLDGLLLFTIVLIALSLVLPERIQGRLQGVVTLIVTILVILAGIMMILVAFTLLMVMFGLFVATPFGTLAYLGIWGFFNKGGAATTLSLIMLLKIVFAVLLVLSQPRFLQNKGLVLLIALSLVCNVIVSFLHGIVPGFMVSITDAVAAIVVALIGVIWAVIMAVGALIAVVKSIRLEKERA